MAEPTPRRRLEDALAPVVRRVRVARALGSLEVAFALAASLLVAGAIARFAFDESAFGFGIASCVVALGVFVVSLARRVDLAFAARLADESHELDDRLGAAVAFTSSTATTDFEQAAIADALRRTTLDARRAVPYAVSRRAGALALVAFGCAALLAIPTRAHRTTASSDTERTRRVGIDPDVLEGSRADLERLRQQARGRSVEPELAALESVLAALEQGAIDPEEAFRRLDEIGRRIASEPRSDARSAAMESAANALGDRSRRLDAVVEAMRRGDAASAARELAALAGAMSAGDIDRRELDRLRESFERMAEAGRERDRRREELLQRREELRRSIEEEREPHLLDRHRRELERLERELEELDESRRELERLERELRESAEDLSRDDPSSAAEDLEEAFEDLNRMADEEMDEQAREDLRQQLEQLREAMRRQRRSGGEQEDASGGGSGGARQRFRLRAGGAGGREVVLRTGGSADQSGSGGPSSGQEGAGSQGEGASGQGGTSGQSGSGDPSGAGPGEGSGQGGGRPGDGEGPLVLDLRPGAEGAEVMLELPNGGRPSPGPGGRNQGSGAGRDHDPQTLDAPTSLDSSGESSRVEGEHGAGETRSQVIRGAAASGFAGRGYRSVHADYADHAEEMLAREDVPPGYRYFVRRYFQMIRPREERSP